VFFISHKGSKPGCVALRTGTAAGLWNVLDCETKQKCICKQWAKGATAPLVPTTALVPHAQKVGYQTTIIVPILK